MSTFIFVLFSLNAVEPAYAQSLPSRRAIVNYTEGFDLDPEFTAIAFTPNHPDTIYIGTGEGVIYVTHNGGVLWDEIALTHLQGILPVSRRTSHTPVLERGHYADPSLWPQPIQPRVMVPRPRGGLGFENELLTYERRVIEPRWSYLWSIQLIPRVWVYEWIWTTSETWLDWPNRVPAPDRLLRAMGDVAEPAQIYWISIDPNDPQRALAGASMGIYITEDGGRSWARLYASVLPAERRVRYIQRIPNKPRTWYFCTDKGLFHTEDDGFSFNRVLDPIMGQRGCHWIALNPENSEHLWVGTNYGVWVSYNSGRNFHQHFYARIPGGEEVYRIRFSPQDPNFVAVGARKALFLSRDGGETFTRSARFPIGEDLFIDVDYLGDPNHLVLATENDLWESTDGGKSWNIVLFGNTQWKVRRTLARHDPSGQKPYQLWIMTQSELFRLVDREGIADASPDQAKQLEEVVRREPDLSLTLYEALRVNGVLIDEIHDYHARSRWSHIFPRVQAAIYDRRISIGSELSTLFALPPLTGETTLPVALQAQAGFDNFQIEVQAWWDVSQLAFRTDELQTAPPVHAAHNFSTDLRRMVVGMYTERRRLQIRQIMELDQNARARLLREMRLEELTALLNALTGGLFDTFNGDVEQKGWPER